MSEKILKKFILVSAIMLLCSFAGYHRDHTPVKSPELPENYPITPVPFTDVHLTDHFWEPRIEKMFTVTIHGEIIFFFRK